MENMLIACYWKHHIVSELATAILFEPARINKQTEK